MAKRKPKPEDRLMGVVMRNYIRIKNCKCEDHPYVKDQNFMYALHQMEQTLKVPIIIPAPWMVCEDCRDAYHLVRWGIKKIFPFVNTTRGHTIQASIEETTDGLCTIHYTSLDDNHKKGKLEIKYMVNGPMMINTWDNFEFEV